MVQYIFGHSSEEIIKMYIATIDDKKDRYVSDLGSYLQTSYSGNEYVVDNSPMITFRTSDLRKLISDIDFGSKNIKDTSNDVYIISNFLSLAEGMRVK